ncbi:MAG: hypothetical protein N3F05_00685 [Candidatus Diapherotrites archaeon]|nr:hypothetical protein [Candidatus Diapherotrites archaeon]
MALKPFVKVSIVLLLIFSLFFFAVFLPSFINQSITQDPKAKSKIKIIAFLKSDDSESARFEQMLKKLSLDKELAEKFTYEVIFVDISTEKLNAYGIELKQVPCFILGNETLSLSLDEMWLKSKIIALSKA